MQDASDIDLNQFHRWYARAGTPRLKAEGVWNAATDRSLRWTGKRRRRSGRQRFEAIDREQPV